MLLTTSLKTDKLNCKVQGKLWRRQTVSKCAAVLSINILLYACFLWSIFQLTYYFSSREDDGQPKGWNYDARREEDGQLFAGITGRVCVIDHPPRDAVRDGREDVEEEEEQRPVLAAEKVREIHTCCDVKDAVKWTNEKRTKTVQRSAHYLTSEVSFMIEELQPIQRRL